MQHIHDFYNEEREDARFDTPLFRVEFLTTMRYIERYLTPGARIIEIGAGSGWYSHALARMGYAVDAVELVDANIEIFKRNTAPGEPVTVRQGDARDLSAFADGTYDITLLLGPMYHLFTAEDQRQALTEAIRVTKPGGVVFAAYCGFDAALINYGFLKGNIWDLINNHILDPDSFEYMYSPTDIFSLYRKDDIDALMAKYPVTRLHFVATNIPGMYEVSNQAIVDAMDTETYNMLLKYHFSVCERPDMTGCSHHTLDVFRV